MSHFAVLVITPDINPGTLEAALQPFHEYECTGVEDQYVIDQDITEEARATFEKDNTICVRDLQTQKLYSFFTPAGEWDLRFSQPKKNAERWENNPRERYVPPGYEQVTVPTSVLEDFASWAAGYYGENTVKGADENVRIVQHTNPNKKWDWWVVGGRYRGRLQPKPGVMVLPQATQLGTFETIQFRDTGKVDEVPDVDQVRKSDLDWEAMRLEAVKTRTERVEEAYAKVQATFLTNVDITALWQETTALYAQLEAEWEAGGKGQRLWDWMPERSPRFKELMDHKVTEIGPWDMFSGANVPASQPDPFVWAAAAPAISLWSMLTADGRWLEKGEMGWFGMSSGDKPEEDWEAMVKRELEAVPEDHFLSFVDCHI